MANQVFPKNFLWGASTAAHQVEGNTHNQWSVWEKAHANRLAKTAPQRLSWLPNWEEIKPQATDPQNYISGSGVKHYTKYKEDFDVLKQLNMNTFRFSIEWSRIEPEEGKWNEQAITHYHTYIAELQTRHIKPVMTLWHWTVPVWFAEKGGFEKHANLRYFDRFVQKVVEEYGAHVHYILTLNEPNVYTAISYVSGDWPPQQKSLIKALRVYKNLISAHKRAYAIIKQTHPDLPVGPIINMANGQPSRPLNFVDVLSARVANYVWNRSFLNRTRRQQDLIGINYYNTDYYQWFSKHNPRAPLNDMGWYMEPGGIETVIEDIWQRYQIPILITENGLADAKDTHRQWWIEKTLDALRRALGKGVDLKGYLHWSLLDNFEWDSGWWPKFGLIAVDRKTMRRTIRPSARWFAEWLKNKTH